MMKDKKAEELEAKGLYRRAARRWTEIMLTTTNTVDEKEARRNHDRCLALAKRPPLPVDTFGGLSEAATATQRRMGIKPMDGRGFNDPYNLSKKKG